MSIPRRKLRLIEHLEDRLLLSAGSFSNDQDIGAPALAGSATYDMPSDTYTVTGSGAGVAGTSDQFHFTSRTLAGNGSIAAYVNSISNTDPSAKAGVMMRTDATASSAFAGVFVSAQLGIVFQWRSVTAGSVQEETGPAVAAPVSLELTRSGKNSFSAFYSTDGINWISVGPSQLVPMPSSLQAGLAVTSSDPAALCTAAFSSVGVGATLAPAAGIYSSSDQLFLNDLEMRETQFFYNETNPNTGLIPDNASANGGSPSVSSIASIGFGLTALTIADARGWLTHDQAYQRVLTTLNFLYNTAASVNGFFYHFLDPATGARSPGSELSSVDTAELMAGVVSAGQYWAGTAVQTVATNLFNRVNWPWMQQPSGVFYGAWTSETGFSGGYGDFSEAVLLYLLGLGSPTHPISRASWTSWSRTPIVNYSSYRFVTADDAALFTVQYPLGWFDLRGLTDSTGLNYYTNAQTATLAQRQWMMTDEHAQFSDYGPNLWGLTPSESRNGYTVWGGPPAVGPIDGTVVPTGPGGSLAFTPRLSLDALKFMKQTYPSLYRKYGLVDAFNPLTNFASSQVLGIDIGMTVLAAENARSGMVWNNFNQSSVARQAMASAFASIAPQLESAVSRKILPNSTPADLSLNISGEGIEYRSGGPTQLVLTFDSNIVAGPGYSFSIAGPGAINGSSISGSTLTLNLSGVSDQQATTITIHDLRHFSSAASGDFTINIAARLADANQDGRVNALDFNVIATNYGASGSGLLPGDINADGVVNTLDFTLLAGEFGKTLSLGATAFRDGEAPSQPLSRAAIGLGRTSASSVEPSLALPTEASLFNEKALVKPRVDLLD